jgi:hypothetical protein
MGLNAGPIRAHAELPGVSNGRGSEHAKLLYAKPGHLSNRPELGSLSRFYLVRQVACSRSSTPGLADWAL